MKAKYIKDLKKGELFTLKPVKYPNENIVWVRNHYDKGSKKYAAYKYSDINHEMFLKGDRVCYVDFIF